MMLRKVCVWEEQAGLIYSVRDCVWFELGEGAERYCQGAIVTRSCRFAPCRQEAGSARFLYGFTAAASRPRNSGWDTSFVRYQL